MMERINSQANPKIRNVVKLLEKASERRAQQLIVIEGAREISLALQNGFRVEQLFVCPEAGGWQSFDGFPLQKENIKQIYELSNEAFAKIAYRETTGGVVALAEPIYPKLNELTTKPNPLILVLESVEKPGNLGAILRTADAAAVDAVVVCDPQTDIYNPNAIRSSLGCVFSNKVLVCRSLEAIEWFKQQQISTYAAALVSDAKVYHQFDYTKASAIVMGTEANGLSDIWLQNADYKIIIPMLGMHDSLNVSTAAAVLTFEAVRQRTV
jgi:TrmH family RNA methyltransferase